MGTLDGTRVLEIAAIGPAPFGAMLLADMGADVLRVDRTGTVLPEGGAGRSAEGTIPADVLNRGKRSVAADLKNPTGVETVLRLAARADVLVEGFRPGVAERLGIGPDTCLAANPRLIYARMTGWGQDGPYAPLAGHDINYIALAGVLAHIGRKGEAPVPPVNFVGDFGGGGLLLAFGVACALVERDRSGRGQVIDVSMVDGAALLATQLYGLRAAGMWHAERGTNIVDGGAPYYDTYRTSDGKYVAVGAMEPKFYALLLKTLGLDPDDLPDRADRSRWNELRARIAAVVATRTRDEWAARTAGEDACVAPVLDYDEAHRHPHNVARGTFLEHTGVLQPAPAPRFSRTPAAISSAPPAPGRDTDEGLRAWGFDPAEIARLRAAGAVT